MSPSSKQVPELTDALRLLATTHFDHERLISDENFDATDLFDRGLLTQVELGQTGEYAPMLTPEGFAHVEAILDALPDTPDLEKCEPERIYTQQFVEGIVGSFADRARRNGDYHEQRGEDADARMWRSYADALAAALPSQPDCGDCGGCGEEIRDLSVGETVSVGPCPTCDGSGKQPDTPELEGEGRKTGARCTCEGCPQPWRNPKCPMHGDEVRLEAKEMRRDDCQPEPKQVEEEYRFARCRGSKEIHVGSPGYGSPGDAYAPCFGCPDCLREEDAWICDGCGKWAATDTTDWDQRGPDDAGVTVEFCPACIPAKLREQVEEEGDWPEEVWVERSPAGEFAAYTKGVIPDQGFTARCYVPADTSPMEEGGDAKSQREVIREAVRAWSDCPQVDKLAAHEEEEVTDAVVTALEGLRA